MLLHDSYGIPQDRRDRLKGRSISKHRDGQRVPEHMRMAIHSRELEELGKAARHLLVAVWSVDAPDQK